MSGYRASKSCSCHIPIGTILLLLSTLVWRESRVHSPPVFSHSYLLQLLHAYTYNTNQQLSRSTHRGIHGVQSSTTPFPIRHTSSPIYITRAQKYHTKSIVRGSSIPNTVHQERSPMCTPRFNYSPTTRHTHQNSE